MLQRRHSLLVAGVGLLALIARAARGQTCVPCDTNCNGTVNTFDIQPFIDLLSGGTPCSPCAGDVNCNGTTNTFDINGFIDCLIHGGQPCPEGEGSADLDIDSDNNNDTSTPGRTLDEELVEDDVNQTGKFVLVNNDDDDHNGTADKDQDGAISAEQDDLTPIVVELTAASSPPPANLNFKLTYPANIRIWKSATRGNLATDVIGSGVVQQYATAGEAKTYWVEGLTPSAAKADVRIVLEADTDGNGSYEKSDAVRLTVVSLTPSLTSVTLGTVVAWTLSPAIAPLNFTSATTGSWTGIYVPDSGSPTSTFTMTYTASQVRETSVSVAGIVVGDGSISGLPAIAARSSNGLLRGNISFAFAGGLAARRSTDLALAATSAKWEVVSYPSDGLGPPTLDGEPSQLLIYMLSETSDPTNPEESLLLVLHDYHYSAVVRMQQNATTVSTAPATLLVDLIAVNSANVEIGRVEDVVLLRDDSDNDPAFITYKNNLNIPIILVDTALNVQNYPNIVPFRVQPGGAAIIVPAGAN